MLKIIETTLAGIGTFAGTFAVLAFCQTAFVPCIVLAAITGTATAIKAATSK